MVSFRLLAGCEVVGAEALLLSGAFEFGALLLRGDGVWTERTERGEEASE